MLYLFFGVVEILLVKLSIGKDLGPISSWLIGINLTLALFSVNFTFFGYQLSKYKPIWEKISKRQWINITLLLSLPFIPILMFLWIPAYYALIALWLMPIIIWSAYENAQLTASYLSPVTYLKHKLSSDSIEEYLGNLYTTVSGEVVQYKEYLDNLSRFQIPAHELSYSPDVLGVSKDDLWDKVLVVTKLAFSNNDYPVFMTCIELMLPLLENSYSMKSKSEHDYDEITGVALIAHKRFLGLLNWIAFQDKEGSYIEALTNRLCTFLRRPDSISDPLSKLTENIAADVTYLGTIMLKSKQCREPMKVLNTIHAVIELAVHKIEEEISGSVRQCGV